MRVVNRFLLLLPVMLSTCGLSADWPQFRGPGASGVDASRPAPVSWNVEAKQNVAWKTPVAGLSHASPILYGDRLYVITATGAGDAELKVGLYGDIKPVADNSEHEWRLLALDSASGRQLWNVVGHKAIPRVKRHPKSTHANSTPATDGRHIVAIFGSEGLFCFDTNGHRIWTKDLGPMDSGYFASPTAQWGFASSPVIHQGKVVVLCDVQTNSFLAAFEITSGREIWRIPRADVPTWGTPTAVEADGGTQIVVNGWKHSGGYDFATGKERWRLTGGGDIPVPTPIVANELIILTSAHGKLRPMRAIRASARGDITPLAPGDTNSAIAWVHPRQGNYMQTPIVVSNRVYGCSDSGVLTCFDLNSGAIKYSERLSSGSQGYSASPVSDGRHLYFSSETGKVLVVPVGNKFSVTATNDLTEICMATPALRSGAIFFRTRAGVLAIR